MAHSSLSHSQSRDDVAALNKAWSRVDTFFDALLSLIRTDKGQERAAAAIIGLESQQGRNIVVRFSQLVTSGRHDFWILKHIFGKALPSLHATPQELLRCLTALQTASKGDMAASWILSELEDMARKQFEFAQQLVEYIFQHPVSGAPFLTAVLAGLSTRRFNTAIAMVERGINSKTKPIRQAAIHALGRLSYNNRKTQAIKVCSQLAAIAANATDEHAGTAVVALGQLLPHLPVNAGDAICTIVLDGPQTARRSVPFVLSCAKGSHDEVWFKKALLALADLDVEHLPEGNWLDIVLSECCHRKNPICLEFLDEWLRLHPEAPVSKPFSAIITELGSTKHADWLANKLPIWFTARQNFSSWRLADELLKTYAQCGNSGNAPYLSYAAESLDRLDAADIHFLIRKTIAYTFVYPRLLCSTVISCLCCRHSRRQVDTLVYSYFAQIIGRNYFGATEGILKPLSQSGTHRQKRVAGNILNDLIIIP